MQFVTDDQTIQDIGLYDSPHNTSVFSLFNETRTAGGSVRLQELLNHPSVDRTLINHRIELIRYFTLSPFTLLNNRNELHFIELYLQQQRIPRRPLRLFSFFRRLTNTVFPKNEFYVRQRGASYLRGFLVGLHGYFQALEEKSPAILQDYKREAEAIFQQDNFQYLLNIKKERYAIRCKLDFYFRNKQRKQVEELLDIYYYLDTYNAIATASVKHHFTLPEFVPNEREVMIEGLFHPFLHAPTGNDMHINEEKHLAFLTGPNMAGKSTFMKAFGMALYLAHCGFPVPAKQMKSSLFHGLYTTINLSDSIIQGYSHFYSEVKRIKFISEQLRGNGHIVVVFDELFRGTNVKDAYDATLSIIKAFSTLPIGVFLISTHLIEVAELLKEVPSVTFHHFEIITIDDIPTYTYLLKTGISHERLGMYILEKEKVIDTIRQIGDQG